MSRGDAVGRWIVVATASLVLLAAAGIAIAMVTISDCSHAEPGSPQRQYCDANLDDLALLSPLPLIIGALVLQTRDSAKRLAALSLLGLVIAGSPVLAALFLGDS